MEFFRFSYFKFHISWQNFKKMTRLAQYGIYYISGGGEDIESFVASPWYLSPERLLLLMHGSKTAMRQSDIWAFGIILLEMSCVCYFYMFAFGIFIIYYVFAICFIILFFIFFIIIISVSRVILFSFLKFV